LYASFEPAALKRAFRRAARRLHPDTHPDADPAARRQLEAAFASARDAYLMLLPLATN
jgi:curved DNA-binding protein CbpA